MSDDHQAVVPIPALLGETAPPAWSSSSRRRVRHLAEPPDFMNSPSGTLMASKPKACSCRDRVSLALIITAASPRSTALHEKAAARPCRPPVADPPGRDFRCGALIGVESRRGNRSNRRPRAGKSRYRNGRTWIDQAEPNHVDIQRLPATSAHWRVGAMPVVDSQALLLRWSSSASSAPSETQALRLGALHTGTLATP